MIRTQGLYDPACEHDACGVGFVAQLDGRRSHAVIEQGIQILRNLQHRGATGADAQTGDGAGILLQLPERFLRREAAALKIDLPAGSPFAAGMCFLPRDDAAREQCLRCGAEAATDAGLHLAGWREVPIDPEALGKTARSSMPVIRQCFVSSEGLTGVAFERALYRMRKLWQRRVAEHLGAGPEFYVVSLSSRTMIYKGLMKADQMTGFFKDLRDETLESALAIVHQRYSTNTFPSWPLAQPFRYLAHNGEINTLKSNRFNMQAREPNLESEVFGDRLPELFPVIEPDGSDSAALDNVFELLTLAGRGVDHVAVMMIPQGWGPKYPMGPDLRGFFEYHAGFMEPWDGPAAVAFSDGRYVGGLLDRNGLRPARYTVTHDGFVVFASETGALDIPVAKVREKGSLRPGEILLVDTSRHRLLKDCEIKMALARRRPYRRWVQENRIDIHGLFNAVSAPGADGATLYRRQCLFGYTREDEQIILNTMAVTGQEPKGSMGADQPLAVFSEKPQLLYWYFKQMFAQVTNPAIDPIRESLVMSLMTGIGNTDSILTEKPGHARLIKMPHPFLTNEDLERICRLPAADFASRRFKAGFPAGGEGPALERAIDALCDQVTRAARRGTRILIISDRDLDEGQAAIPMLLAVAAVHQRLIREALRTRIGIIAETGEARDVMHMALLLGYGASALNPYLAFETIAAMAQNQRLDRPMLPVEAVDHYIQALCGGILKIMSKMGISTLRSYRGARIFEAIGLNRRVIDRYFEGTPSRIQGIGLDSLAADANARHAAAMRHPESAPGILPSGGQYHYRTDGERHLWSPRAITLLQRATRENDTRAYTAFADEINHQSRRLGTLRGLLRLRDTGQAIPIEEVEPVSRIVKRFATGAMSYGSLSPEAHRTLAVAMNRLGAMSNSGEGGEEPQRFVRLPNGDSLCSAVKQIASGRFGVTIEYLVNARELQIKIAQGAKPGEGGHLPGHKVNADIARVRHSTPGVTLISPPPHHDIYSIEDIAQLIRDLRCANPSARIAVKLVSEYGVGTVAAGVAKGRADVILISGGDGGTGAAPLSSIKHTGLPWELGLSEAQQTLTLNGLRDRVRLQADGQLRTGRDVLIAALLGAEEFGFATAPLVVCGCVMMRKCHTNTCPAGVATQDPACRQRFQGRPEHVQTYFEMVAGELRGYMARLGVRHVDELIGRSDWLETEPAIDFWKARDIDLSAVLARPSAPSGASRCTRRGPHELEDTLDAQHLERCRPALERGERVTVDGAIRNIHRSVGTLLAGKIARRYGAKGLPDDTITLRLRGTAGQSFAAFAARGMTFVLEGEANDYVAKGLSGARVIIKPPDGATYVPHTNIIAGNVILYGATAGDVYINGQAGERFAIRNSGATAVVEGIGDHGCEYMTGGTVVVLGPTGVNFGAGMSGGIAYVFDSGGLFDRRCNLDTIDLERIEQADDERGLRALIERHVDLTGSRCGREILDAWEDALPFFIKVFPIEYRRALGHMTPEDAATLRKEPEHE